MLRYDTRGHGKTSAPPAPYTLELLADDLVALMDALGIERVHFVGISLGGMVGQVFALGHPERLASLVLCDTTSHYSPDARPAWEERIRTVREKGMEAMVEPTLARWFTPAFRAQRPDMMKRVAAMIRATPVEGYIGCCHAIPRIDTRTRLQEIRCPTLVIVGEEDPGTPVAMARAIHEAIPGSRLAVIPQASHLCNLEQTVVFNRILRDFLAGVA